MKNALWLKPNASHEDTAHTLQTVVVATAHLLATTTAKAVGAANMGEVSNETIAHASASMMVEADTMPRSAQPEYLGRMDRFARSRSRSRSLPRSHAIYSRSRSSPRDRRTRPRSRSRSPTSRHRSREHTTRERDHDRNRHRDERARHHALGSSFRVQTPERNYRSNGRMAGTHMPGKNDDGW